MRVAIVYLVVACFVADVLAQAAPERVRVEAREIYAQVVAFKTSEGMAQVPIMASYLAGKLRSAGFPDEDIHILPLGETASLVVRYRGNGTGGRPILLVAHMDVVTANPKEWARDPFTLVEENGYFFGRGTADIKADVTAITTTFLRLKREGFVPTRDLIIAFTGDEETEQATTRDLVENHRPLTVRGESPASHRDERGASGTRRDDREYGLYLKEEQRRPRGCVARRMQTDFHHGLLTPEIS